MPNYFDELYNINSNYNHQLVFHLNAGSDGTYEYINNNKYILYLILFNLI